MFWSVWFGLAVASRSVKTTNLLVLGGMDAPDSAYWDNVTATASLQIDLEDALHGNVTLSVETNDKLTDDSISEFVKDNFFAFLNYLKFMDGEERIVLLSVFLLLATQNTIGGILGRTQTVCSQFCRIAIAKLGYFVQCGGYPSADQIRASVIKNGLEPITAEVVILFEKYRNLVEVARMLDMPRPVVKRVISAAAATLIGSAKTDTTPMSQTATSNKDRESLGFGCYLHRLISGKDPTGRWKGKAAMRRVGTLHRTDPDYLGQFRIPIDKGIPALFIPKSNKAEE